MDDNEKLVIGDMVGIASGYISAISSTFCAAASYSLAYLPLPPTEATDHSIRNLAIGSGITALATLVPFLWCCKREILEARMGYALTPISSSKSQPRRLDS